jgi:hypothetical protein
MAVPGMVSEPSSQVPSLNRQRLSLTPQQHEARECTLYWEAQNRSLCWLHSLNMLLGRSTFAAATVHQKLQDERAAVPGISGANINMLYTGRYGPYSEQAINRYLYRHASALVQVRDLGRDAQGRVPREGRPHIRPDSTKESILATLPQGAQGFLVGFTTAAGVDHMKTIKYDPSSQLWWALDSMVAPHNMPRHRPEMEGSHQWHPIRPGARNRTQMARDGCHTRSAPTPCTTWQ